MHFRARFAEDVCLHTLLKNLADARRDPEHLKKPAHVDATLAGLIEATRPLDGGRGSLPQAGRLARVRPS